MAPLGHAVSLVHAEEREPHACQRLLHCWSANRLGGDENQLDAALAHPLQIRSALLGGAGGIDARHSHTCGFQLADLVLDKGQ